MVLFPSQGWYGELLFVAVGLMYMIVLNLYTSWTIICRVLFEFDVLVKYSDEQIRCLNG
jgi:hypothetical protein